MILHPKQTILRAIQRAGYIVQKLPEYRANEQKAKEVQEAFGAAHVELVARRQQTEQDAGKLRRAVEEITGLRNQTTNVEARNAELRQQIAASYSQIDALQGQLTASRSEIDALRGQLTASRSEIDALQGQLSASGLAVDALQHQLRQARGQEREFHNRLVEALDEIRRLKIRVEELPEIDYQVLMREQQERAAFQDTDAGFMPIFERVKGFSMTSVERLYAMYKATEYVCRAGIPGSIVESGVWRGGSMMMAALTLQALGDRSRQLILFDTFEGLPKPNETEDVDLWGHSAYNEWTRHRFSDEFERLGGGLARRGAREFTLYRLPEREFNFYQRYGTEYSTRNPARQHRFVTPRYGLVRIDGLRVAVPLSASVRKRRANYR